MSETRLVSFLGTNNYTATAYSLNDRQSTETPFVCRALAEFLQPKAVRILATDQAREKHEDSLRAALAEIGIGSPDFVTIPKGVDATERWQQFQVMKEHLRAQTDTSVVLDITHGFRSQPLFAAAVIAFVRAVDNEIPALRICYGNFEERGNYKNIAPIWEVTEFIELLNWSQALATFLKSGRAEDAANATERLGRSLAKSWASGDRSGPRPALDTLGRELRAFGADLETLRTGDLLIGHGKQSSAKRVVCAARQARAEVEEHAPPLADVLDRITSFAEPLARCSCDLSGDGKVTVNELATLYLALGRYAEAAATVREGWVNFYANPSECSPGSNTFSNANRQTAERWANKIDEHFRAVTDRRNDLLHAQYRSASSTQSADNMKSKIAELVGKFRDAQPVADVARATGASFLNLTNHPSSDWDSAQRDAALALAAPIFDLLFPAVPADTDEAAIGAMAEDVVAHLPPDVSHALVQGEFTLTLALVQRLQRRGIVCLAATTERRTDTLADGRKASTFAFVRFRAYPSAPTAE